MRIGRNHGHNGAELRLHVYGGGIIVDGTCTFIIDDVRDGTPVGQVRASMFVPAGYVKLEGATVNRSNYPRLVALADTYSLWTDDTASNPGLFGEGDGSTTMVLPNWTGRMAQFASTAGAKVDAGVPNITGDFASMDGTGGISLFYNITGTFFGRGNNVRPVRTSTVSQYASIYEQININASRSNSIYGNATTVQPPAINVFAIMRY